MNHTYGEFPDVDYRDIPGFPGYRVDIDGNVWTSLRKASRGYAASGQWRRLRGGLDKDGYRKIILCCNGRRRYARVHMLVLELFIGPAPDGMISAHENGVRSDCRLSNLRWDTQKNNIADKKRHGTHQSGEKHGQAVLRSEQVREIRACRLSGEKSVDIARRFGVSPSTVSAIVTQRLWKDVV